MATTTPNFGWPVPTSTDLVKDGATAIEALGDGIDTSMVDLKGGTTGQILAKATNADMDFAWITNDVGDITAITASSPLTGGGTSGDVTVGILDATTSNKGAVQLSTSTTSTSTSLAATASAVKAAYDPAFTNNFYAGKNKIINGDFGIWQRGTSLVGAGYLADRFQSVVTTTTVTQSQQGFTPGTAPVAGYEGQYFYRNVIVSGGTAGSRALVQQPIEDVRTFAGQTATVSFWAKAASGTPKIGVELAQVFGSGGSAAVTAIGATAVTISTSWTRYTVTASVPSISGKTIGTGSSLNLVLWVDAGSDFAARASSIGNQSGTFDIWGVQIEAGSVATPFQTATGTIQGELAACQRYYVRIGDTTSNATLSIGTSNSAGTVSIQSLALPVAMRVPATTLDYANIRLSDGSTGYTISSASLINSTTLRGNISCATTGMTGFRVTMLDGSATGNYVGFSAEL